ASGPPAGAAGRFAVAQTFLSAGAGDFLVPSLQPPRPSRNWKVPRTRRLESLRYRSPPHPSGRRVADRHGRVARATHSTEVVRGTHRRQLQHKFHHSIHSTTTHYIKLVQISHGEKFEESRDIMLRTG